MPLDGAPDPTAPAQPEVPGADGARARRVLGNTAVLAIAQVSGIVISLLLTPYILSTIGVERFGLWAFVSSIVAWAALLQFGIGKGTIRFVAYHAERGELATVRQIVSYGFFSHLLFGVLLTPIVWLVGRMLLPHLHVSPELVPTAETLFPLVFGYAFLAGAVRPFAGLVVGLEKMWMTSIATLASQLFYAVIAITVLHLGAGLYGLVGATYAQTAFQGTAYYAIGRRLIGRVVANPLRLDRRVLREMLKFGGWLQLNSVAGLVNAQTDNIVIGSYVDVRTVGFYSIGAKIAQLVRIIPLTLLSPLLPAFARIHAQGNKKQLDRAITDATRLLGLITLATAGFVIAAAPLLTVAWLGRPYPHVATLTILLVVATAAATLPGVGIAAASAIGRPRYESEFTVLSMVLNIVATVALAPVFGLYGIVVGTVFGLAAASAYFFWRFCRVLDLDPWEHLGWWLWRLLAAAGAAIGATVAARTIALGSSPAARAPAFGGLVVCVIIYTIVFLLGLRSVRFFDASDLTRLTTILPPRLRRFALLRSVGYLFGARV